MDSKAHGAIDWLGFQLHQLKEQEHAGPVMTTVVVVLLTYALYTVSVLATILKIVIVGFLIFIG